MKLYKYCANNKHTENIFINSELYFALPSLFNDPFDSKLKFSFEGSLNDIRKAYGRALYSSSLHNNNRYRQLNSQEADEIAEKWITPKLIDNKDYQVKFTERIQKLENPQGVLCLSEVNNNILMWSHYAEKHTGICLEFSWPNDDPIFGKYQRVKYQTHYESVWAWLYTYDEIAKKTMFIKSIDWVYEKEYRILVKNEGCRMFPKESLTGVIFGCQIPKKIKDFYIEIIKNNKYSLELFDAIPDISSYSLNVIRIK
jgi:hypothetical protein